MTGLKEIDGKWYQPCKVVILTTNSEATVFGQLCLNGNFLFKSRETSDCGALSPQHLYFTSDEEIKEGDLVLVRNFDIPTQSKVIIVKEFVYIQDINYIVYEVNNKRFKAVKSYCKKVIAATDTSLKYGEDVPGVIGYKSLPQPSQQFIEKYIEEYNKGNQITDVLVEVEEYMTDGWAPTYNNPDNHNLDKESELDYRIKVNPKDNTITIRKQKDSWTREEVITLIREYRQTGFSIDSMSYNKWIEENL